MSYSSRVWLPELPALRLAAAFATMELAEPTRPLRQDRLKPRDESAYFHS
jgi:hypothetical protein